MIALPIRTAPAGRTRPALVVLALAIVSAGCGASRPVKYYVLDATPGPSASAANAAAKYPVTILVARISSSHLYRDDRLVYGSGPVQLGTYEYQRWSEPPAEMVQDSLVSSLRATGQYLSVSPIGSNLRGEYILRGHLYALDEVDKPEIAARFSMAVELFDARAGATVWTSSYSHDTPVNGKSVPDVVQALDQDVHAGLAQLAAGLGEYFAAHPPRATATK
jgi:ABC-type uncharacterized transport system auxiliary subunit